MKCLQNSEDFGGWLELVQSLNPKVGIEIGTKHGGSAIRTVESVPSLELFVSVDICSVEVQHPKVVTVQGDSRLLATRDSVVWQLFQAGYTLFDFLFIDGLHSFDGVAADFYSYGTLVRPGGLIGLHDIFHGRKLRQQADWRVPKFWHFLSEQEPDKVVAVFRRARVGLGVYRR